jgi:hypothetical protein
MCSTGPRLSEPGTSNKKTVIWVFLVTEMTFEENGAFHGFVDVNGKRQWNFGGKWVLSGDWLHYHYTKSDMP